MSTEYLIGFLMGILEEAELDGYMAGLNENSAKSKEALEEIIRVAEARGYERGKKEAGELELGYELGKHDSKGLLAQARKEGAREVLEELKKKMPIGPHSLGEWIKSQLQELGE